jgi:transposase
MKNTNTTTHVTDNQTPKARKCAMIKLGIDVHADSFRVVRQLDSATPQPAQKMSPQAFLVFARKQLALAAEVHSCYEAGPFGYGLHRQLLELGIKNVVVRPQNWDELGRRVKTDKTDALALVQRLDRYAQGNTKALAVITVPTEEQEQSRAQSRQREQLQKDRQTHEAQGRSLLLYCGHRVSGAWWKETRWIPLQRQLPAWLAALLQNLRQLILCANDLLEKMTLEIQVQATRQPRGVGLLTSQILEREVLDWNRFGNRRQVASMTGLCPGVRASGNRSIAGPITKHGNPRLRRALIELAWRLTRFQSAYGPVARWRPVLEQRQNRGARKKAIVAIARKLAIDLWRVATKRCTAADLNLAF